MSFLLHLLLEFFGSLFLWSIPGELERRSDRKRLLDGEVRCWVRASSGRVLNIGTDWSVGIARIEPGMLRFSPAVGIVGDRTIPVHVVRVGSQSPLPRIGTLETLGPTLLVDTTGGQLRIQVPSVVADDVVAILETGTAPTP